MQRERKLTKKFDITLEDAKKLVAAGYDTPGKIRRAKKSDVDKVVKGVRK